MRAIRTALAVVVGVGVLVFAGAGTALACSCAMGTTDDYVGYADVVATGTITGIELPPDGPIISSGDPVTYTVDVEETFKGEPQSQLTFISARDGASCGLEGMQVDRRYTFFLVKSGADHLSGGLCSGTRPATDSFDAKIARITGPPVEAVANPTAADPDASASIDFGADTGVPLWVFAALGGGTLILAAGGILVWRRAEQQAQTGR